MGSGNGSDIVMTNELRATRAADSSAPVVDNNPRLLDEVRQAREKPPAEPLMVLAQATVPVTRGPGGVPVLQGNPNQLPDRAYPGGIGPDVQDVQTLIDHIPGPQGYAAQVAFSSFLKNYNTRVTESTIPKSLPLFDLPTNKEADRKYVWDKLDHWSLKHDVDMYSKKDYGPFTGRDLRPNTDTAPGGGKLPPMFFAVGLDKENKPVDILEYYKSSAGNKYREQYQFNYEKVVDGRMRVTVYNWMDSTLTRDAGPREVIGNKLNTLEGVSQYYYDPNSGKCTEALYYNGYNMKKPMVDLKFNNGQVQVSERNANSGEMTPWSTPQQGVDAIRTARNKGAKLNFFNLLGPGLPDLPNGQ
jgi:hypothetical protein